MPFATMCDPADHIEAVMPFDPMNGLEGLEDCLHAMKTGASARGFAFSRHDVRNELQAATFRLREPRTVRLVVSATGAIAVEVRARAAG